MSLGYRGGFNTLPRYRLVMNTLHRKCLGHPFWSRCHALAFPFLVVILGWKKRDNGIIRLHPNRLKIVTPAREIHATWGMAFKYEVSRCQSGPNRD
jgi:hypothetical protein